MSVLQIRLEEELKDQVSELFERLGMDIPTAVRIFFRRSIVENGLPFDVKTTPSASSANDSSGLLAALRALNEAAEKSGAANMTEAEIEAEIKATREAHINR